MKFNQTLKEASGSLGGQIGGETYNIYMDFSWPKSNIRDKAAKIASGFPTFGGLKLGEKDIDNIMVNVKVNKKTRVVRMTRLNDAIKLLLGKKLVDDNNLERLKKQIVNLMKKNLGKTLSAQDAGKSRSNPFWDAKIKAKQLRPDGPFVLTLAKGVELLSPNEKEKKSEV